MKKITTIQKVLIILAAFIIAIVLLVATSEREPAENINVAFGAEFLTRPDGYDGLKEHYDFEFRSQPMQMLDGLLYKSLANGAVDVINAFSTDGRIPAYNLVCLEDDKNFFPPYYPAPLIRSGALEEYPQLREVLSLLAGKITNKKMQQMNYKVDEQGEKAKDVAVSFLIKEGLISQAANNGNNGGGKIVIASKEFTEQEILGQVFVELIKARTNLEVDQKLKLGGTIICFNALKAGDIDLYPEYTGTGLVNILKEDVINDPDRVYEIVAERFKEKYDLIWLEPLGFNNTYTLTLRKGFADKYDLQSISDLTEFVRVRGE